jgi:predicted lipid-binding transport protein (Tim44 family)
MQFQGIGSALTPGEKVELGTPAPSAQPAPAPIPGFDAEPFVRVAKTSFIRLQAANDAKDLDDIRDFTTPEMFAEISMQIRERGDEPQKTEVVMVDARVVESVVEGDYAIASVRFTGLIRENDARNPEPFDEIWHVRKNLKERNGSWLIAGIQQSELA